MEEHSTLSYVVQKWAREDKSGLHFKNILPALDKKCYLAIKWT